jgi:hypothetical protein
VWEDTTAADPKAAPAPAKLAGIAAAPNGTLWAVGKVTSSNFKPGAGPAVAYTGPSGSTSPVPDIFLAKLDPNSISEGGLAGSATAAFDFGDANNNQQLATAVAVASSGNVGIIGTFKGEIDFTAYDSNGDMNPGGTVGTAGLDFLTSGQAVCFYAVIDGSSTGTSPTPIKAHMIDVGLGQITSIGSNPTQNAFALCGSVAKAVPDWNASAATKGIITGGSAVYGDPNDPTHPSDIVVAKIDAVTGNVLWGKQFGGAGSQGCDSVTIDNNGDVIIAGGYAGTLDFGGTAGALPVVADANVALLYLARLDSTTGSAIKAKTWGTVGRTNPYGLAVDGNRNVLVAGVLGGKIDFGGGISILDQGLTDVFAAKLGPALDPIWAKSFGDVNYDQSASTVGVDSSGSVFIGGNYLGKLSGLGLTATGTSDPDAFLAQLSPYDGSPVCAYSYGSAAGADGVATMAVARMATGSLADAIMVGGSFSSSIVLDTSYPRGSADPIPFVARLAPQ